MLPSARLTNFSPRKNWESDPNGWISALTKFTGKFFEVLVVDGLPCSTQINRHFERIKNVKGRNRNGDDLSGWLHGAEWFTPCPVSIRCHKLLIIAVLKADSKYHFRFSGGINFWHAVMHLIAYVNLLQQRFTGERSQSSAISQTKSSNLENTTGIQVNVYTL
jgi:hypothetical protein